MPACTSRSVRWQTLGLLSVIGQEQKRVRKTGRWVENENYRQIQDTVLIVNVQKRIFHLNFIVLIYTLHCVTLFRRN